MHWRSTAFLKMIAAKLIELGITCISNHSLRTDKNLHEHRFYSRIDIKTCGAPPILSMKVDGSDLQINADVHGSSKKCVIVRNSKQVVKMEIFKHERWSILCRRANLDNCSPNQLISISCDDIKPTKTGRLWYMFPKLLLEEVVRMIWIEVVLYKQIHLIMSNLSKGIPWNLTHQRTLVAIIKKLQVYQIGYRKRPVWK